MAKLSCGIIGLPNVGKSTLFNALTRVAAASSNYPFCTIDPNVGVVDLYDPRLAVLSNLSGSERILYATVQFTDIAGLVKGASKGEGLGNQFLSHIRETSALIHVVRCFENQDIIHVAGRVNPIEDIETVELELALSDLERAQNILGKIEKQAKSNKAFLGVVEVLKKVVAHLDKELPLRTCVFSEEEKKLLEPYPFLTQKKVLYVANVEESDLPHMDNKHVRAVREYAEKRGAMVVPICAKIEEEISQLEVEEQADFLKSLGLEETGLNRLARSAFDLLGLITFLTTGEMETRAWTIERGEKAPEAAGKIHTDIQKGFIRAEVIAYDDMVACGGKQKAREMGKLRAEGRDYVVQDGDVITFLHS